MKPSFICGEMMLVAAPSGRREWIILLTLLVTWVPQAPKELQITHPPDSVSPSSLPGHLIQTPWIHYSLILSYLLLCIFFFLVLEISHAHQPIFLLSTPKKQNLGELIFVEHLE